MSWGLICSEVSTCYDFEASLPYDILSFPLVLFIFYVILWLPSNHVQQDLSPLMRLPNPFLG
jgi:hypothetical protein